MGGLYIDEWDEAIEKLSNLEATAKHTARMMNKPVMTMNDYYWNKILNPMVEKYERKYQMTREEAIEKLRPIFGSSVNANGKNWIQALEALGLLKFEKEEKRLSEIIHRARLETDSSYSNCKPFVDYLDEYGYKIVRK